MPDSRQMSLTDTPDSCFFNIATICDSVNLDLFIGLLFKIKVFTLILNGQLLGKLTIPPDVWKKMGGQLTKTGEEKLKAMKDKSSPKVVEPVVKKTTIPFTHGVRLLKGVIERERDLELTDGDYIEILDIAQERNSNLPEIVNAIHNNLSEFLTIMKKALHEWDKKTGKSVEKSREKFYPEFYAKRKDEENPGFLFSLTNTKVLTEALQGDFDLVYLVRRELANRGLDGKGKWFGFDEAKKVHRVV